MLRDWTSVLGRVQKRERERCSRNRSHSQKPKPKTKTKNQNRNKNKTEWNRTVQNREHLIAGKHIFKWLSTWPWPGRRRRGRGSKWVAGCNGSKCPPQAHKSACMKWCSCVSFFSCFQAKCRHSLGRKLWGNL